MSIFYHVSTNLNHSGVFTPRIPFRKCKGENNTIERICVSSSIENCLSSMPGGGEYLCNLNFDRRGYYLVCRIDTEKLNIRAEDIISAEELYNKGYVTDAKATNESWITKKIVVPKEDMFLINIYDWDEELAPIIPYSILQIAEDEYYGDYAEAYLDAYKEYPTNAVIIKDLKYTTSTLKAGEQFILTYQNTDEGEQLVNSLDCIKDIVFDDNEVNIIIETKLDIPEVDLTDVFLTHIDYLKELGDI